VKVENRQTPFIFLFFLLSIFFYFFNCCCCCLTLHLNSFIVKKRVSEEKLTDTKYEDGHEGEGGSQHKTPELTLHRR